MRNTYTVTLHENGEKPRSATIDAGSEAEAWELSQTHDAFRHSLKAAKVRGARPHPDGGTAYITSIGIVQVRQTVGVDGPRTASDEIARLRSVVLAWERYFQSEEDHPAPELISHQWAGDAD